MGSSLSERRASPGLVGLGWVAFAGTIMFLSGFFHVCAGLIAVLDPGHYLVSSDDLVVGSGYAAWGWAHLVLGLVLATTGTAVVLGQRWARVVGAVVASCGAVLNVLFLAADPSQSVVVLVLDLVVIFALIVHGDDADVSHD